MKEKSTATDEFYRPFTLRMQWRRNMFTYKCEKKWQKIYNRLREIYGF